MTSSLGSGEEKLLASSLQQQRKYAAGVSRTVTVYCQHFVFKYLQARTIDLVPASQGILPACRFCLTSSVFSRLIFNVYVSPVLPQTPPLL